MDDISYYAKALFAERRTVDMLPHFEEMKELAFKIYSNPVSNSRNESYPVVLARTFQGYAAEKHACESLGLEFKIDVENFDPKKVDHYCRDVAGLEVKCFKKDYVVGHQLSAFASSFQYLVNHWRSIPFIAVAAPFARTGLKFDIDFVWVIRTSFFVNNNRTTVDSAGIKYVRFDRRWVGMSDPENFVRNPRCEERIDCSTGGVRSAPGEEERGLPELEEHGTSS